MRTRRDLAAREIRMAICAHDRLDQVSPLAQGGATSVWQTTVKCAACDFAYVLATPTQHCAVGSDQELDATHLPARANEAVTNGNQMAGGAVLVPDEVTRLKKEAASL